MHWGLIVGSTSMGGIENQMLLLARGLMKLGHEVTVICSDHPECRFEKVSGSTLDFSGIPMVKLCIRRGYRYFYYPWGKWQVKRRKINLLIGNDPANAYAGSVLSGGRIPLVTHISGLTFALPGVRAAQEKEQLRIGIKSSHTVISNTQIAIDTADALDLIPQGTPCRVIHNGVIAPSACAEFRSGRLHVLYVGRLHPIKDPMTMLKALEIAKKDLPELTGEFVGSGALFDEMQNYITEHKLGDFVKLSGFIPPENIPYTQADLLVNSSASELSSGAIAEALYRGIPVIASDVGGNPELAGDPEFGALFPPGDAAALAKAIVSFGRKSLEERRQMGNKAREFAEKMFALENYVQNYIDLANDVLNKNR